MSLIKSISMVLVQVSFVERYSLLLLRRFQSNYQDRVDTLYSSHIYFGSLPAGTVDVELNILSQGSSPTKHKLHT